MSVIDKIKEVTGSKLSPREMVIAHSPVQVTYTNFSGRYLHVHRVSETHEGFIKIDLLYTNLEDPAVYESVRVYDSKGHLMRKMVREEENYK
jgi:hypothetical protein